MATQNLNDNRDEQRQSAETGEPDLSNPGKRFGLLYVGLVFRGIGCILAAMAAAYVILQLQQPIGH